MIRNCLKVGCVLSLLAGSAQAQESTEAEGVRTRFYNFDGVDVSGGKARPDLLYTDARERARFEKLFSLKRSFLPELRRTADGAQLSAPERR